MRSPSLCHPERRNFGKGKCWKCWKEDRPKLNAPAETLGMSVPEIAIKLNTTPDSIRGTLKRAMKKLRDGRAEGLRDLMIARDKEANHGLPKINYGDIT